MQQTVVFQQSYDFYKHLYLNLRGIPKRDRFTWGERCEGLALRILLTAMQAETTIRANKKEPLAQLSRDVDALKIFLRLGHDLNILDQKKYLTRSAELVSIGKMVGGWLKSLG